MAQFPIQSTTGDPIFRSQHSSISNIQRLTRAAADSSIKLNSQERIVSPGEDALSFSTSRRIRSEVKSLKVVQETGQLNITGLGLAVDGLEGIKTQLDKVKKQLVQAQVADPSERDGIQAEIDLALNQIDSAAQNTKLGSRSLLNGESSIQAFQSIASDTGAVTDFSLNQAQSLTSAPGIQDVRVNKVGIGGPTKILDDGTNVLSLNVSISAANTAQRATINVGAGAAGEFAEYRVTGKHGSATIRLSGTDATTANNQGSIQAFNQLSNETGVVLTDDAAGGGNAIFSTVGYGSDEFIKVELIATSGATPATLTDTGGNTIDPSAAAIGTVITEFGRAAVATINGVDVELGGENGTTARYLHNGNDIEIDFSTAGLADNGNAPVTGQFNVDLTQGVVGLLGSSGDSRDTVQYGFGNFTTENLGRGSAINTTTVNDATGNAASGIRATTTANRVIDGNSVADIATGGALSLSSGRLSDAISTIDSAIEQVIGEQTRLGTIQGNFIDAVNRAEVQVGNLTSADADIIGVDAATEITNLVQSQLGVSTASSVLSQANAIQANIFSLLRG